MNCTSCPESGCLRCTGGSLRGRLSLPASAAEAETYTGDYRVTPKAFDAQTLPTAHKLLRDDVTVTPVPYFETSNTSGGVTVYIAADVTP